MSERCIATRAQYSLDCENGIENAVLLKPQTPEMLLEEKQLQEQVYAAVMRAAGETGKEDLCPILSGNDGK